MISAKQISQQSNVVTNHTYKGSIIYDMYRISLYLHASLSRGRLTSNANPRASNADRCFQRVSLVNFNQERVLIIGVNIAKHAVKVLIHGTGGAS